MRRDSMERYELGARDRQGSACTRFLFAPAKWQNLSHLRPSRPVTRRLSIRIHNMTRRTLLSVASTFALAQTSATAQKPAPQAPKSNALKLPAEGRIPVAFPISKGVVMIDYAGPWEVFQDANNPDGGTIFELYTVAETLDPVVGSGGIKLVPAYTFATAPAPKIVVIAAQSGNDAMLDWIRKVSKATDVTMSVCTGAFVLAKTGLLDGKSATTHHSSYGPLQMQYSNIKVKRGFRFVETDSNIATAGGLTSGIDLALRVVERYVGRDAAEGTAFYMEYQGEGWKDSTGAANQAYAKPNLKPGQFACPVCGMVVGANSPLKSSYKSAEYRFCSSGHKEGFDANPAAFLE
jgi:putative intracellular protease/amidase/YHS domain-containing protein